jgi:hypothetical protein
VLAASMICGQIVCANMLSPFAMDTQTLGFNYSENNSMFLGQWKKQIAEKISPNFYSNLDNLNSNANFTRTILYSKYLETANRFIVPVFADNFTLGDIDSKSLYFSFSTENQTITPFAVSQMFNDVSSFVTNKKEKSYSKLVGQEIYTPSYIISNGKSSFGIGAVLVQQRFLDDSFGNMTYSSSSTFQPYNDKAFINTNRGTGYQLNFIQQLPAEISLTVDYRSRIEMNEFDSFGSSYSEPGDFDIPRQYSLLVSIPFSHGYKLNLSSENIGYSNSNTIVHAGYSPSFLHAYSSPIRDIFELKDLTVYSVGIEQQLTHTMSWKAAVVSRQQAPATTEIYNNILKNDTAAYSYRLGFSKNISLGEFNFYASFANKPLLIGGTEFGRITSTQLTRHIEGVASWGFSF